MRHNQRQTQRRQRLSQQAFSLMEVLAAMSLASLMAVAGARSMRLSSLGALEAKTVGQQLTVDLIRARRLAISTGIEHRLIFDRSQHIVIGYRIMRGKSQVGMFVQLPNHIEIQTSGDFEFAPNGAAHRVAKVQLAGRNSTGLKWTVTVATGTGTVFLDPS